MFTNQIKRFVARVFGIRLNYQTHSELVEQVDWADKESLNVEEALANLDERLNEGVGKMSEVEKEALETIEHYQNILDKSRGRRAEFNAQREKVKVASESLNG